VKVREGRSGRAHCLDTSSVYRVIQNDVLGGHIFNHIDLARILADGSHGKAQTVIERAVRDVDIGRVLLHAYRVVSITDDPAQESDVVGIDRLYTDVNKMLWSVELNSRQRTSTPSVLTILR